MHPSGKFLFTGDQTGKILMWDARNFSLVQTIVASSPNRPIRNMAFVSNDSVLIATEGNQGRSLGSDLRFAPYADDTTDNVVFYRFYGLEPSNKTALSGDIFPSQLDTVVLLTAYNVAPYALMGASKRTGSIRPLYSTNTVIQRAAISKDGGKIAVVETDMEDLFKGAGQLKVMDTRSEKTLIDEQVSGRTLHMYFDETLGALFLYIYDADGNRIAVLEYPLEGGPPKEVGAFPYYGLCPSFVHVQYEGGHRVILASRTMKPMILEQNGRTVSETTLDLPHHIITAAAFIPGSSHLVYCASALALDGAGQTSLHVYDYRSNTPVQDLSGQTLPVQKGCFLPGNAWFVGGGEQPGAAFSPSARLLKYYEQGTLSNRFERLSIEDYLEYNHRIVTGSHFNYTLEEQSGKMVFMARVQDGRSALWEAKEQYVVYDLTEDKIDLSFKQSDPLPLPISYRDAQKRLLTADFPGAMDRLRQYEILQSGKKTTIEGRLFAAELSNDGEYLLRINESGLLEIKEIDRNNTVHQKQLFGRDFRVGALGPTGFWIDFVQVDQTNGGMAYQGFIMELEDGRFQEQALNNYRIKHVAYNNNQLVMLIEGLGMFMDNERFLLFPDAEEPYYASFNSDGSLLMVSFNNGMIRVYQTDDLKLRGIMTHPDARSHVLLSASGHFISNADSDKLLYAEASGRPIPLDQFDLLYNQPQEVLNIFGTPDPAYQDMIARVAALRKSLKGTSSVAASSTYESPQIKTVAYNGQQHLVRSDTKVASVSIEAFDAESNITGVVIAINGVPVVDKSLRKPIPKGSAGTIEETLTLANGDNRIDVRVVNERGLSSGPKTAFIRFDAAAQPSDLYVLAVGVSKYQQNGFDLTFADKDALDMAILYGDKNTVDVDSYRDTFMGTRYLTRGMAEPIAGREIRNYGGVYVPVFDLIQADMAGSYWIEASGRQGARQYTLWDFNKGAVAPLTLPAQPEYDLLLDDAFMPDPDNRHVFFRDEEQVLYAVDLRSTATKSIGKPFNGPSKPISKGRWVAIDHQKKSVIDGDDNLHFAIRIASPSTGAWTYNAIDITIKDAFGTPELLAASPEGNQFLVAVYDDLWLIALTQGKPQVRLIRQMERNYGSTYHFTTDNTALSCLDTDLEHARYYTLNLSNNRLDSQIIHADNRLGINNASGRLHWVETLSSIAKQTNMFSDDVGNRSREKPASFNRVYVKTLTNQEATNDNIRNAMDQFLKPAALDDQIIVFFAGHGLLDRSLQYFFAPYDMDFNLPQSKGIAYSDITAYLKKRPSLRKLLIMDTCHSGDVFSEELSGEKSAYAAAKDKEKRGVIVGKNRQSKNERISDVISLLFDDTHTSSGITVLAASSGSDVAYENKEISNGALTAAYIEEVDQRFLLDNNAIKGSLTSDFLYNIQKKVIVNTGGKQIPNIREMNKLSNISIW